MCVSDVHARRRPAGPTPLPEVTDNISATDRPPVSPLTLWYKKPGHNYDDALPIGNGRLGGMVNGGVSIERIWLNEDSLWSSGPLTLEKVPDDLTDQVAQGIAEARKLMFEDKVADGEAKLFETIKAGGLGGRIPQLGHPELLGMLDLHFADKSTVSDYRRDLDLTDAIARVRYRQDGVLFTRECFASHPDQVIVMRLEADKPGKISFVARLRRGESLDVRSDGSSTIVMKGKLDMQFIARVKAIAEGGEVFTKDNELHVKGADSVTVLVACATTYIPEPPTFRGNPYEKIVTGQIQAASGKSYEKLKKDHIKAHRELFGRMSIDLGKSDRSIADRPTDVRYKQIDRSNDPELLSLIFQYARYLMISTSRPGCQPANLQGLWIGSFNPMWCGDYHLDLNIQMCYWAAGVCNLAECSLPVADLVEWTIPYGRNAARRFHGVRKGWVCHLVTNPHGYVAPISHPRYGYVPGSSAWLMQTLWDHYDFTRDREYLSRVWPMFVEAGEFWLQWLVPDPETGKLVSGPATSPETMFEVVGGQSAGLSMGPAYEQQCVWELFTEILEAADTLGKKNDFVDKIANARKQMLGPLVSKEDGSILEWAKEKYVGGKGHRHRSHLIALYPGRQITLEHTPELAKAAAKSLDSRGMGGPPWTPAWDIALNARLKRSKEAMDNIALLFSPSRPQRPNLLSRCGSEFQLDANIGYCSAVAEMLIQSHAGYIELLPCLPEEWPDGSVTGICARGGFEVDMRWKAGKLLSASLLSKVGGKCKLRYKGKDVDLKTKKGGRYELKELFKL